MLNHYIPRDGLYWHRYTGQWIDAGTVQSLVRAATLVEADARDGKLVPPVQHAPREQPVFKRPRRNGQAKTNGSGNGNGHNGNGHGLLPETAITIAEKV